MILYEHNLDTIISKLSKEKRSCNGVSKRSRILLVSETNNACLSLSTSSDEELEDGAEPDLHQCGHCKLMFNNLTKYITHKIQKKCWLENTPIEDQPEWSSEQNGSSSPGDVSTKDEFEEEPEQVTVKVKNLQQKRKHRKGFVHRLKPLDATEENASIDALQQVFDDEETVFIQGPSQTETLEQNDNQSISTKASAADPTNQIMVVETKENKNKFSMQKYTETSRTRIENSSSSSASLRQFVSYGNPRESLSQHYYSQSSVGINKFDRVPSKLPQVMSTRGSSSSYENVSRDKPYVPSRHDRHSGEYQRPGYHPYYDVDTSSTWTLQYRPDKPSSGLTKNDRKGKYKSFSQQYDKYRTMITLNQEEKPIIASKGDSNKEKSRTDDSEALKQVTISTEPPELVRIGKTLDDDVHKVSMEDQSIPTLERCGTPIYVEPKVEEDGSRDSIIESSESQTDEKAERVPEHDETVSGLKFQNVSSPEKEINSPNDSSHSHETEDFTQESHQKDITDLIIPRHRQLSESTVERLITEPSTQGTDASWKHAKQVYRCPLCAKIFPFKSKLQRHVLVHTGIKPYKCTVCGRGFTQQIDLQRHLTRHTGEKPFKCHLCKAQFIRADNLRKHCKDAHYVNIEEPIRKRRRKTTGSDTVLPPLEVAIALALSETERNGGRVLGRAVTRSNTKTTVTKARPPERRGPEELSYHQQRHARPEISSYPGYPRLVSRQDLRYSFPSGPMESTSNYPVHRRMDSPPHSLQRTPTEQRNSLQQRDGRLPSMESRLHSAPADKRLATDSPPQSSRYSRAEYERDSGELYFKERERRRQDEDLLVSERYSDTKSDPMYQMDYHSMAMESRNPIYRSSNEHKTRRLQREYDYQSRHPISMTQRVDDRAELSDRRTAVTDSGFHAEQSTSRFNTPTENERQGFLDKPTLAYDDFRRHQTHHSPEEIIVAERRGNEVSAEYRRSESYETYEAGSTVIRSSKNNSDPVEFVSMAANRDSIMGQKSSSPDSKPLDEKPVYVETPEEKIFIDEQEIPIVTPSDAASVISKSI